MSCRDELVRLLSNLLKIDTSNPPGNESNAAGFLKDWLSQRGVESEILEFEKGRGNLFSRIKGSGEGPSLLLLSHTDVVPADSARWRVPPFSGAVKDGYIWGRGALDMKSMVAVETMVFSEMVDKDLKGDLVLLATADEEKGGSGIVKMLEKAGEKIIANYVINEGGGEGILTKNGWLFDIQTAERGVFWYRVQTKGSPAHGSVPGLGVNAIDRMRPLLNRVSEFKGACEKVNPSWKYVESLLKMMGLVTEREDISNVEILLNKLAEVDKGLGESAKAMLQVTMTPTMIQGGVKENVVPYECKLTVDCRVPPGYSGERVKSMIMDLFHGLEYELEFIQESEPTVSPVDTPLYRVIENSLLKQVPGARLEPTTKTGGTDSRYFRRMGIPAYGFQPLMVEGNYYEWSRMVHGDNERISIENLLFCYRVLKQVVESFMLK
ncbi:MAG: M20/M25/M40 family metallo-hydrolase [Thaumarchaeota archaeon]|jgi:acetylornithine deacetylase/succinyl-diaminopimelate desuccinylase-like protein|nr:M20/M25/M40 family metallo-hydrolase [Nitrososphaerota archaeon]